MSSNIQGPQFHELAFMSWLSITPKNGERVGLLTPPRDP
jgi:hypothetical protein